jgi:o-succinylbenzoate synthase
LEEFYKQKKLSPSLQFGLDSLAYRLMAHEKDSSLLDYLFPEAPDKIPVNALGDLQSEDFLENTKQQAAKGYKTIKFKVGLDFNSEYHRLKKVRAKFPDLTIRLDANQAWSTETALRYLQKLEPLNIEYCEEPLKNATPENFELLHQHTKLPLALDESVAHLSYWPNLLPFTSYFILKPMLLGSFTKIIETKRLANTHTNKAVFTTSLESGVGRKITAILAAGLGSSQTAHGLDTGKLLAEDVHSDIAYISKGVYHLNRQHQPKINFQLLDDVT